MRGGTWRDCFTGRSILVEEKADQVAYLFTGPVFGTGSPADEFSFFIDEKVIRLKFDAVLPGNASITVQEDGKPQFMLFHIAFHLRAGFSKVNMKNSKIVIFKFVE